LHRHRNEAILDPLTGLYNRRYLEDFFQRVSSLMRRHGKPHSFIMLDIDHFKEINDAHGHETGDKVLKEVSDIIRGSMRQGEDMPARIGGEEFALIVHGGREQAFVVAEKIRKKVSENWGPSRGLNVSISAGISEFAPDSVLSGVMKEADEALYRAKKEGRNRSVISGESKGPD
jgi:diguanylate cyclase (GGDEF)-like protein